MSSQQLQALMTMWSTLRGQDILPIQAAERLFDLLKAVRINLSGVAGAGSGYQVKLSVGTDASPNNGVSLGITPARAPAKNDSGSIRFYDATGVMLPMFVETYADGSAEIWVKVAANLDTDQHIYMLDLGDAAAANVSDGNAVFELFDHFNAGVLDAAKWTGVGVDFSGAGQAAYARLTGANADITLQSVQSFGDGYELVVSGRFPNASAGGHGFIAGFSGQYSYYNPSSDTANSYIAKGALGADQVSQGSRITNALDLRVSIGRAGGVGRVIGANQVGVGTTTNSAGVSGSAASITLNHVYATGQTGRVDYAFVRRWIGTVEPTVTSARQIIGSHDHSSDELGGNILRILQLFASTNISCFQTGAGLGSFGVNIDTQDNTDCHGVYVNARATNPATVNKIGNMRFGINGITRWTFKKDEASETGGNAGSSMQLQPHDDAGNSLELSGLNFIWSRDGRYSVPSVPPASATAAGRVGTITWDANYIYVCVAANTWKRVALTTW